MSLAVRDVGSGSPMMLLHGFTGSAASWDGQLEAWAARHRVIAPDLLGHGRSDAPHDPADYDLDRQAAALADLLASRNASPATLVGYSMGARLALVLALSSPERVDRLVLESPSAGIADAAAREERRAADERLAQLLDEGGIRAFVDRWEAQPLFASHADLPETTRAALRAERLSCDPLALAACLRGAGQGIMEPLHDRLASLGMPVLVIAGGRDAAGLDRARLLADRIPDAGLRVIVQAGHTAHLESPAEFAELVEAFLPIPQPSH